MNQSLEATDRIPREIWDNAAKCVPDYVKRSIVESIARAIMAARAEAEAERDLLQSILDGRPAINAALPDSYIIWSQAIYSGEAVRVALSTRGEG